MHGVAVESKNEPATKAMITPAPLPVVPTRTATPAGQINASTDPDVDITTPDSDGPAEDGPAAQTDREPQGDEIIKKLEKGLPKWPGFGEHGWMDEIKPVSEIADECRVCQYLISVGTIVGYRAYN